MRDSFRPPIRLNLGCGLHAPVGWVNIDRTPGLILRKTPRVKLVFRRLRVLDPAHMVEWPPSVVRHDLRRRLPFVTSSVDAVYSSHTLEHLYLAEARALLTECLRVLRPGGILRLALPDAALWAKDLLEGHAAGTACPGLAFNERLAAHPFAPPTLRRRLLGSIGAPTHRWQPSKDLAVWLLEEVGFTQVEPHSYRCGALPDVDVVEVREESLFVEGTAT